MNNLKDFNQTNIEEYSLIYIREVYYDKETMNFPKTKYLRNTLTQQEKKIIYSPSIEKQRRTLRPENYRRTSFYVCYL